jgi:TonB-dependent receptor
MTRAHLNPLLAMGFVAAGLSPQGAWAQAVESKAEIETVTVTGYRESLATALEAKRNDTRVTDGISAEDIGKFPSENIAEAIQRIPGVQISNVNGRGATISVRGLGPQYANTTVNGQTYKSADFTDGFRYDIIQTELSSGIQVIKSPTANMDSGGLSGTVNIQTLKPLDFTEPRLTFGAKLQESEFADGDPTPKGSVTYLDQFMDGRVGLLLNAGYQELDDRADYLWMDRWFTSETPEGTLYIPRRPRFRSIARETDRTLLNGALQFRPTDDLKLGLTALYAEDETKYDVNQQVFGLSRNQVTVLQQSNLTATRIRLDNFTMENNRQLEVRNLSNMALTGDLSWSNDLWKLGAVAHYTEGKTQFDEEAAILAIPIASATLDISNPNNIVFDISTNLANAAAYNPATMTRNEYPNGALRDMESDEVSLQFDANRKTDLGLLASIDAGVKVRQEGFDRKVSRRDRFLVGEADPASLPLMTNSNHRLNNFIDGDMSIQHAWVAPDIQAYRRAMAAEGITIPLDFAPESSYGVDQDIYSIYAMGNIETSIGSLPLRGNIGVRYEDTRRTVNTYITTDEPDTDTEAVAGIYKTKFDYNNTLPSANFVLELRPELLVRLSLAKVLVRQILDSNTSLAKSQNSGPNNEGTITHSIDLGQPNLLPLTAEQADLGVEWYYGEGNGLTLTGFYKDVKNGTFDRLICPGTYESTALSTNAAGDCVDAAGNIYDIRETRNDPTTVTIKGYEVGWTQSLDAFLPIDGFGTTSNYTRVLADSNTTGYRLRNTSEHTWNITGYWENRSFSARVSLNHRSEYIQDSSDSFFAREGHTIKARNQVDAVLGYNFDDSLSFSLGALNINNYKEEAYKDVSSRWQMYSVTGPSYYLSAQWRMR